MSLQAELVLDCRNGLGHSPVWMASEQALVWVDTPGRAIWRWQSISGRTQRWETKEMPACLARHQSGGWIVGMESAVFHIRPEEDGAHSARTVAAAEHARFGMRFGDGRCDRQGRLRAGTMVMDLALAQPSGVLYALDGEGALRPLVHGLLAPAGLAFSPDGRTMYLGDAHPRAQQVWAYDYDIGTGTPLRRRPFVDAHAGRLDGAAVDEDGCYWTCGSGAGLVHRFTPAGRLDRSLAVPVAQPAMCAFGGSRLDTLFVTSRRPDGVDLADQPLAGGLFALKPGVRGLPEPACAQ